MPFCPKCKGEYREGADECSICQIPLVEELEPEPRVDGKVRLVEIYRAPDQVTAVGIKGRLESAGIPATVQSVEAYAYEGWLGLGRGYNAKVFVKAEDAARARSVIETALAGLVGESERWEDE